MSVLHRVRARNLATASTNKIHDDAVARTYGFEGGLVPGVDVFGYVAHAVVEHFGPRWLEDGTINVRFEQPVYDARPVTVERATAVGAGAGTRFAVVVRDDTGATCATAAAALGAGPRPDAADYPVAPLPDPVPAATAAALAAADPLGSTTSTFHAERAGEYLDAIGETHTVYRTRGVAHPAWLLRRANRILAANVRLGPWIHVESDASYLGLVHDGDALSTRGRVQRVWEHRGHEFVMLDLALFAGDEARPVVRVAHTAIFRPRRRAGRPAN
jgi:hypothetical protein